jgi:hypothetical protein
MVDAAAVSLLEHAGDLIAQNKPRLLDPSVLPEVHDEPSSLVA